MCVCGGVWGLVGDATAMMLGPPRARILLGRCWWLSTMGGGTKCETGRRLVVFIGGRGARCWTLIKHVPSTHPNLWQGLEIRALTARKKMSGGGNGLRHDFDKLAGSELSLFGF